MAIPFVQASASTAYGNRDDRVSRFRKCWIESQADGQCIVGVYGPGTSREITANFSMPFEGENVGGHIPAAFAGIAQKLTGLTSISTMNSAQAWAGNQPMPFTLEFILYALEDPESEVMTPLRILETWIAPDVGKVLGGTPPGVFLLNIGTKVIYTDMLINSITMPFDKEVDSQGNFVRATVNIQMSSATMVSKDMLKQGYGIRDTR